MHQIIRTRPTSLAFALWDLVAVVGIIAVAFACLIPSLGLAGGTSRDVSCVNNQRLLTAAAHRSSTDHKGRFFRHWLKDEFDNWPQGADVSTAWWSIDQVGNYLDFDGKQPDIDWRGHQFVGVDVEPPEQRWDAGFFDERLICPETHEEVRSYQLNFWASGIDATGKFPKWHPSIPAEDKRGLPLLPGEFFNRNNVDNPAKTILFGEAYALRDAVISDNNVAGWATDGYFGRQNYPGERFGGVNNAVHGYGNPEFRWGIAGRLHTQIDSSRHGGKGLGYPGNGFANFATVDGAVKSYVMTELFDSESFTSTFELLWSNLDHKLEAR